MLLLPLVVLAADVVGFAFPLRLCGAWIPKRPYKAERESSPFRTSFSRILRLVFEEQVKALGWKNEIALHTNRMNRVVRKRRSQALISRNLPLVIADDAEL